MTAESCYTNMLDPRVLHRYGLGANTKGFAEALKRETGRLLPFWNGHWKGGFGDENPMGNGILDAHLKNHWMVIASNG